MRPQFSILILIHERPGARCLASLRMTRTRDDAECLVLANGAGPEVLRVLRAEPGLTRLVIWRQQRSAAAGRQALIGMARGRILVFLDANAVIEDSLWLDRLAAALKPANVGAAGPGGRMVRPGWRGTIPAQVGLCDFVEGGCLAIKRALRSELDAPGDDAETCLQVRRAGWDVWCSGPIGVRSAGRPAACEGLRRRWQGRGLVRVECGYDGDLPGLPHPKSLSASQRGTSRADFFTPSLRRGEGAGGEVNQDLVEEGQGWHARAWQI